MPWPISMQVASFLQDTETYAKLISSVAARMAFRYQAWQQDGPAGCLCKVDASTAESQFQGTFLAQICCVEILEVRTGCQDVCAWHRRVPYITIICSVKNDSPVLVFFFLILQNIRLKLECGTPVWCLFAAVNATRHASSTAFQPHPAETTIRASENHMHRNFQPTAPA